MLLLVSSHLLTNTLYKGFTNVGLVLFQLDRFFECIEVQKYIIAKFPEKAALASDSITTLYDKLAGIAFQTEEYVANLQSTSSMAACASEYSFIVLQPFFMMMFSSRNFQDDAAGLMYGVIHSMDLGC